MIIEFLLNLIEQNPKAQILKMDKKHVLEFYDCLVKYHINPPTNFAESYNKLQFMGRKIEIYEPATSEDVAR